MSKVTQQSQEASSSPVPELVFLATFVLLQSSCLGLQLAEGKLH